MPDAPKDKQQTRDKGLLETLRDFNKLRAQAADIGNAFFEKSTEHNGPSDAMRHIIFNAKLTAGTGSRAIPWLLDKMHEYFESGIPIPSIRQPNDEMRMDLINGAIGREIGKLNLTDAEMVDLAQKAVQSGKAKTLIDDDQTQNYATGGLVGKLAKMAQKLDDIAEGTKAAKKTEMFIGPMAGGWDPKSHALALKMEDEGASPRTIWEQTMNWRTPQGSWVQEISDKDVEYNPTAMLENAKAKYKQQAAEFNSRRQTFEDAWNIKNLYDNIVKNTPHDFYMKDENGKLLYHVTGKPVVKEGMDDQLYDLHQELKKQALNEYAAKTGQPVSERAEDIFRNTPAWRIMYESSRKPSAEGIVRPSATTVRDLPMKDALIADELFANYPRLAGYSFNVHTPRQMGIADASFNPYSGDIKLSSGSLTPESSLLHELQHGVQQIEGWEGGTSPAAFTTNDPRIAKQLYLRNLGETMARATEARQNLSIPQRNALFPEDSFTLPMMQPSKVMEQMMWQGMPAEKKALIRKYVGENISELSNEHRRNRSFESSSVPLAYDPEKVQSIVDDLKADIETPPQKFGIGGAVGKLTKMERALARMDEGLSPIAKGETKIIKDKGGNWLSGSDENVNLTVPEDVATGLRHAGNPEQLNDWIDKKLVRYIKNDMGTAEDEVRKLFDQGISHTTDVDTSFARAHPKTLALMRTEANKPSEPVATTELGKKWEDASDSQIFRQTARATLAPETKMELWETEDTLSNNPWLLKVPPETPIYQTTAALEGRFGSDPLGFRHLVDELRNATVEDSTLPEQLRLDPKKLDKVTVPQAVQLVDKINKWREANIAEANLSIANNPATILHKDYPEEGFRWVQLRNPLDPKTRLENPRALAEALEYEGNAMGHCVGGYCRAVEAGDSQIFSLRDKKGQPHVTIEVEQDPVTPTEYYNTGEISDKLKNELDVIHRYGGKYGPTWSDTIEESPEYQEFKQSRPLNIVQIKGKSNEAPIDKYIPFVQDFIKSRTWNNIDDLANAKMYDLHQDPYDDIGMGLMQLRQRLREAGVWDAKQYYTEDELRDAFKQHGIKTEGYAKGGIVRRLAAVAASCGCNTK